MPNIETKNKILEVAKELIVKNGYSNISSRRIAKESKISIGTLFYHFPNGKLSILYEIILSYGNEFIENLDISKVGQFNNPEIGKAYLFKYLEKHRQFAPLINGFEIELLTNKNALKDLEKLMQSEKNRLDTFLQNIFLKFYPNIKEPEKTFFMVGRICTSLIHTHIILDNFYGTDEEFIDILYKMLSGLLTNDLV
ncbi:MAG: TetR/AcrR family transcriptional regulator [Promethearchaeota archaeon]|jgi:AcrR family transcriptional regulator